MQRFSFGMRLTCHRWQCDDGTEPVLGLCGRFQHPTEYVLKVSCDAKLEVVSHSTCVGRLEGGNPVSTGLYILKKVAV